MFMTWIRIWIWVHFFPMRIQDPDPYQIKWIPSTVIYLVVEIAIHVLIAFIKSDI